MANIYSLHRRLLCKTKVLVLTLVVHLPTSTEHLWKVSTEPLKVVNIPAYTPNQNCKSVEGLEAKLYEFLTKFQVPNALSLLQCTLLWQRRYNNCTSNIESNKKMNVNDSQKEGSGSELPSVAHFRIRGLSKIKNFSTTDFQDEIRTWGIPNKKQCWSPNSYVHSSG
jgi:hypothetical protein